MEHSDWPSQPAVMSLKGGESNLQTEEDIKNRCSCVGLVYICLYLQSISISESMSIYIYIHIFGPWNIEVHDTHSAMTSSVTVC